jgi:acetyl/propionyl-CoA carboxylase alpha subunit
LKVKVNETEYEVEIVGNKAIINGKEILIEIKDDTIIIGNKEFYLDFYDEGGDVESLLIINGMAFRVSKKSTDDQIIKEIRAPMSGQVTDILIQINSKIEKGQGLVILEAMKMLNVIKSPGRGIIKDILVHKNQAVKAKEILIILE